MIEARKKGSEESPPAIKPKRGSKTGVADPRRVRIRCPKCGWRHDHRPHWGCERCFAHFDTFVTRAHCPNQACGNQWTFTQCPRCHVKSPHEDWYVPESGEE